MEAVKKDIATHLEELASDTLSTMDDVARSAAEAIQSDTGLSSQSIIRNSFTETGATKTVSDINRNKTESLSQLTREPAISRVVVLDDDNKEETYFICRIDPYGANAGGRLVNYRAPIGQIAATPVGEEVIIRTPRGDRYFEVIERTSLNPSQIGGEWDSKNSNFENIDTGFKQITSLRSLLKTQVESEDIDFFDDFLDDDADDNIRDSIQHEILTSIGLRDQPILDKFQDEIFRMPLDSQLLILGPPGTGKTTTLIRRLGQKLDIAYLTDSEKSKISEETDHKRSWIMFTPTDLLKYYLKEAFSREQVAASDLNIKTWDAQSRDLGRNVLDILQSATKKSGFILKTDAEHLKLEVNEAAINWYESFRTYHEESAEKHLKDGIKLLKKVSIADVKPLAEKISSIVETSGSLMATYSQIFVLETEIKVALDKLKQESEKEIRKAVNFILNKDKALLGEFAKYLPTIKTSSEDEDSDEVYDIDETELQSQEKTPKKAAVQALSSFIRAYARVTYQKSKFGKTTKNAKIADWLGNHLPDKELLLSIGKVVYSQNALRRFTKLANRFTTSVPKSYRAYRRNCLKTEQWYLSLPQQASHVGQQELDLIILLMLDCARDLLQQHFVRMNLEEFSILKIISDQFKNQILVDEATDFSPIQLACMERLTSLSTGSFFACGDFNQRITGWGTKGKDEFEWVSGKISHETINIVYRQSQKLNSFAGELLELMGGATEEKATLPEHVDHQGVSPVLLEQYQDTTEVADWLFERIKEIDELAEGGRPTIAVLVNSEEEVVPTANALNKLLEDINLQAEACSNGNTIGEGSSVRVFDIQHIKGLEFEAVFFLGVDTLADEKPDLFEKFLYVGATRAATFLGLACKNEMPKSLESLIPEMVETWA